MKCQSLFSGKNKKNTLKYCMLKFLPRVLNVKELSIFVTILVGFILVWDYFSLRFPAL